MGELAHRIGRNADAERYLERALELDPGLVDAQALRGLNLLELGQAEDAVAVLEEALALDREHPTARNGRAWSYYVLGDSREALTRLADLDDLRRRQGFPDEDPHRAWARAQIARIQDHEEKVRWTDRFERREIANGWVLDEPAGPRIDLREGRVWIQGQFDRPGRTRLYRELPADQFVAIQASIRISAPSPVRVGLFVAREQRRRNDERVEAEITVSRHKEGTLQTRLLKSAAAETPYEDVPAIDWPLDEWVPVRIERVGESRDTTIRISVDGIPVLDGVSFPALGTSSSMLRVGVFAEGETARSVTLEMDDVELIRRQP
jgi:tetratricopeptide (TPR) repeat protein